MKDNSDKWLQTNTDVFWGEIAPCNHMVQIYENDAIFMDLLTGFVSGGFKAGDSLIDSYQSTHLNFEHLWNKFCEKLAFSLLCAYPRSGFTENVQASVMKICGAHAKIVAGIGRDLQSILYKDLDKVG